MDVKIRMLTREGIAEPRALASANKRAPELGR